MAKTPKLNLNVPDYRDLRWDVPVNENWNLIDTAVAGKQDIIPDLDEIRSNAQAGKNIIPQVEVNTQRIEDLTVGLASRANVSLNNLDEVGETRFSDIYDNIDTKQDTLVSGTNIKTVNGNSLLGSGNLSVSAQASFANITGQPSDNTNLAKALNAKQDVATAVNYDNITNCITEIPQDIKLELNNGTLTLKAGSKVYKLDGTSITINTDVSLSTSKIFSV